MKIKELLKMDNSVDVYDDVCDELSIAFVGPMELTEEGKEEFAEVLEYDCEIIKNGNCIVSVNDKEGVWQKKLKKAQKFFYSMAGYCNCEDYDKWFKEVN